VEKGPVLSLTAATSDVIEIALPGRRSKMISAQSWYETKDRFHASSILGLNWAPHCGG
jgi:hypothetical protein